MTTSLKTTQTKETDESSQRWPSIDDILKRSNATGSDDPQITISQIQFLLEGMRTKVAIIEAHDLAESHRLGMGYGVGVQAKIFELAEMKLDILRLEECVEAMRKEERNGRRGRAFRRGWQRVSGRLNKLVMVVPYGDMRRKGGHEKNSIAWDGEDGVGVRRVRRLRRMVETWIDELLGISSHCVPI